MPVEPRLPVYRAFAHEEIFFLQDTEFNLNEPLVNEEFTRQNRLATGEIREWDSPEEFLGLQEQFEPAPQLFTVSEFVGPNRGDTHPQESANVQDSEGNGSSDGDRDGAGQENGQNAGDQDRQGEKAGAGYGGGSGKDGSSGDGDEKKGSGSDRARGLGKDFPGDDKDSEDSERDEEKEQNQEHHENNDAKQSHKDRIEKSTEESERKRENNSRPLRFLRGRGISLKNFKSYNAEFEIHSKDTQEPLKPTVSLAKQKLSPKSNTMKASDSNLCSQAANVDGSISEMWFIDDPPKRLQQRCTYRKHYSLRSVSAEIPERNLPE